MTRFVKYLFVFVLALWTTVSYGQLDSLLRPATQLKDSTLSISNTISQKVDSISAAQLNVVTDSLAFYRGKIDSLLQSVNQQLADVQSAYNHELTKLTGLQNMLKTKIDSLGSRALPTHEFTAKADSIQQKITALQEGVLQKVSGVKEDALKKIHALDLPPELKKEVSAVQTAIGNITPHGLLEGAPAIPSLKDLSSAIPGIPGAQSIPNIQNPVSNIPSVQLPNTNLDVNALKGVQVPKVDELNKMPDVSKLTSKTGAPLNTVKEIQSQPVDKLADNKLSGLKEVKGVQSGAQIEGVDAIKSQDALKAELKKQATSIAVDHFSGKQAELKAAMDKLSTYKKKYSAVSSMAEVQKDPPNPMKEKKFIERIVPGLNLQILRKGDDILLDVNPYLGYRITRHVTAGAGWNERIGYNWDARQFHTEARIFGPRVYGEYSLSKGFSPRLELELMNTQVPPATVKTGDPYQRQWVPGAFAGIKKSYKIAGGLRGTATVMFRLFDPKRQSPYGDVINARFGFEYVIKVRKGNKTASAAKS